MNARCSLLYSLSLYGFFYQRSSTSVFKFNLFRLLRTEALRMSFQLSCSFASYSDARCDISAKYPGGNEFFTLSSCEKDVKSHLRQLKVPQTSVRSEKELISAGAGLFDQDEAVVTVCPKHGAALGA